MNELILFSIIIAACVAVIYFIRSRPQNQYKAEIIKEREGKDHFMRTSAQSPLYGGSTAFEGLRYFDLDARYKFNAKLVKMSSAKLVALSTSTGDEENFREYAYAEFEWEGVKNRLLIFEPEAAENNELLLAFKDKTSAKETYGAGRYLDIKKNPSANFVILDFNKAYNPYCAYSESYSCPFPPKENYLTISIKAGEKIYH